MWCLASIYCCGKVFSGETGLRKVIVSSQNEWVSHSLDPDIAATRRVFCGYTRIELSSRHRKICLEHACHFD